MLKFFMYRISLEGIKQLMMMAPNPVMRKLLQHDSTNLDRMQVQISKGYQEFIMSKCITTEKYEDYDGERWVVFGMCKRMYLFGVKIIVEYI